MIALPTKTLMNFCGTYFCVFAPRYMPTNPPMPKRMPKGQSGMGEAPCVVGSTVKNRAPATEVMNVPIKVAPAIE